MIFKKSFFSILFVVNVITGFLSAGDLSAQAQDATFPAYGSGAIQVRLYSDYFCPPCRALEPVVEPILKNLLKKKKIELILVDVPFHAGSPLYARYFLYALVNKKDVDHAMHVRNLLFESASQKEVTTKERIEELFSLKGIPHAVIDIKPIFARFNALIKEDDIQSTPTCVIVKQGKKEKYVGTPDILNALKNLK